MVTPLRALGRGPTWLAVQLHFCLLFLLVAAGSGAADQAKVAITVVDATGREVRLASPARRIATNESLILLSLALIDPEPVALLAGWAAPQRLDPGIYAAFRERFPAIDKVPVVGAVAPANLSVETVLRVQPDLFVVSIWQPGWEGVTERLAAAGIPVIFLDGPDGAARPPAEATAFAIELLGKATGREAQAGAFADFVRSRYRKVAERLGGTTRRPQVLVDAFAGKACCHTPGSGNRISQYLQLAGGLSIGAGIVPGYMGQLSPEYVLGVDPDIYVGTGSSHLAAQGGIIVGGAVASETARASLRGVVARHPLDKLTAVRDGRVHGVSHQLAISVLSVLVFECFAKWTHPDLFADLDPAETLAEINRRFMAVPLEGTFWIGLEDQVRRTRP